MGAQSNNFMQNKLLLSAALYIKNLETSNNKYVLIFEKLFFNINIIFFDFGEFSGCADLFSGYAAGEKL